MTKQPIRQIKYFTIQKVFVKGSHWGVGFFQWGMLIFLHRHIIVFGEHTISKTQEK